MSIKNHLQDRYCHEATRAHSGGGVGWGEGGSVVVRKPIRFEAVSK